MKKLLIALCALFIATTISAQDPKAYYAIDGTSWTTEFDRDKKESILLEKVNLTLNAALASGGLGRQEGKRNHELLRRSFQKCKDMITRIRLLDTGYEIVQNPELRVFLEYNGLTVRNGLAKNKELFNFEEYANCFDAVLNEYTFNVNILEELTNPSGKSYNLQFLINDFSERLELINRKIEKEREVVQSKENLITALNYQFEDNKRKIKELERKGRLEKWQE